ncbi:MAG: hypothetical protein KC983_04580 [Phycisphaerales bacterium]|nr:hypothetical protein [Phycisphaerales bacterium]
MPEKYDLGKPYCGACGHDLTGCTDSSKCPECGEPIIDVLVRTTGQIGRRYQTDATLFGWPIVSIAIGATATERSGHARGIIAIGDKATGGIALGGRARGIVACGGLSLGCFSLGGMSLGLITSWGGCSIGGFSSGGLTIGGASSGGCAIGWLATGGVALGRHVIAGPGRTANAVDVLSKFSFFFSNVGGGFNLMNILQPSLFCLGAALVAAAVIGVIAIIASRGSSGDSTPYSSLS